jgi:hypothetical protein
LWQRNKVLCICRFQQQRFDVKHIEKRPNLERKRLAHQLQFRRLLRLRVVGVTIFQVGNTTDWQSFDLTPMAQDLANYLTNGS